MLRYATVLLALLFSMPAAAQERRFTALIAGLSSGELALSDDANARRFTLQSGGIAGFFRSFRATAQTLLDATGRPLTYRAEIEGGRRAGKIEVDFSPDAPVVIAHPEPLRDGVTEVSDAARAGAIDPPSAYHAILRDRAAGEDCTFSSRIFDGRRLASVTLRNGADPLTCEGVYRREAGYLPQDLEERRDFAFTLTYEAQPDGTLRLTEARMQSLLGAARLVRED